MLVHGSFYTAETRLRPLDLSADERPRYSWTDSRTLIMFIIIIIYNSPHHHNDEDDNCPDPPEETKEKHIAELIMVSSNGDKKDAQIQKAAQDEKSTLKVKKNIKFGLIF